MKITLKRDPMGKGRPRFTKSGRAYTPAKTLEYEKDIQQELKRVYPSLKPMSGPIAVEITASFGIAKSAPKNQHFLVESGVPLPGTKKPDIDNIAKLVLDAMNGIAWADDLQVVSLHVKKQITAEASMVIEWHQAT